MNSRSLALLFFCVYFVSAAVIQERVKRQWAMDGWGGQGGGWQQQSNANKNSKANLNAETNKYDCKSGGLNLLGIQALSQYNCQTSGQSAKLNMASQNSESQGFLQGPLGALMNGMNGFAG